MLFRADITIMDDVHVFLVVARNQINFNFQPIPGSKATLHTAGELYDRFAHLVQEHFTKDFRRTIIPVVRGRDPEHIKRHHGIAEEVEIIHYHVSFFGDITPEIFKSFLNEMITTQAIHNASYQFIDAERASSLLKAFCMYHAEFVGSSLQKEFSDERKLTNAEAKSLFFEAKKHAPRRRLSVSDIVSLVEAGFTIS